VPTVLSIENKAYAEIQNGELTLIWVEPEFQGLGYGKSMLAHILSWMKENKIRRLSFLNAEEGFWKKMKTRFPRNVFLSPNGEGFLACAIGA
jgi:GNAT superfamily N-acetyltransferase